MGNERKPSVIEVVRKGFFNKQRDSTNPVNFLRKNSIAPDSGPNNTHTRKNSKKKKEVSRILGNVKGNWDEPEEPVFDCPLLSLPMKVRVLIWKRVSPASIHALRRTCSRIKFDIEHFVGLKGILDEKNANFEFFSRVGLQSVVVLELAEEVNVSYFLLHPFLLKELYIDGEISSAYFYYITEQCPFITSLRIRFSSKTITRRTYFFPILTQHWSTRSTFEYLESVSLEAATKRSSDLSYVRDNLTALLTEDLAENTAVKRVKVILTHRFYSGWDLRMIHRVLATYTNDNSIRLTNISIEISDKHLEADHETRWDFVGRILRRGSGDIRSSLTSLGGDGDLTSFLNKITDSPDRVIQEWNEFTKLRKLYLAVNGEYCDYWKTAFVKAPVLQNLYLDMKTENNWPIYKSFFLPASETILEAHFHDTMKAGNPAKSGKYHYIKIDGTVFQDCKKLFRLSLNMSKDENGIRYSLANLGRLPARLVHLQLSWIILDPCELHGLAFCHRKLRILEISYWSSSDAKFGKLLCLFRWLLRMHLTKLSRVVLTDSKIRFQNRMKSVESYLASQKKYARCVDSMETSLIYDKNDPRKLPENAKK